MEARKIIITGGATRIGAAIAEKLSGQKPGDPLSQEERKPYSLPRNFHTMTARQKRDARLRMVRDQPERKSSIFETASLLALLVSARIRTLAFVKVRKLTELVSKYTKDILRNNSQTPDLANDVCSYRAGYLPEHRQELEERISRL